MISLRIIRAAFAASALLMSAACQGDAGAGTTAAAAKTVEVSIQSQGGVHKFNAEVARTPDEQQRGYMYRTDIGPDDAMIFTPYPADGGGPREASFWMKNTPTPLDIIFIRPDGTIARIADNTIPFSEEPVTSGEAVNAVLEIHGGRASELGIEPGDKVSWQGR